VRLKADDCIAEIFKDGRASISLGYIGLHETVNALYGNEEHIFDCTTKQQKALQIITRLKQATQAWSEQSGYAFSLYSTPSENLCDRFCRLDAKRFGVLEGVTDKGYYTNSFHLDVEKAVNPYDKLDFEMAYPPIASGGFICYGEYPNMQHNLKALEDVWDYSYSRVPYYGTNTPIDECYECKFTGEFDCTSKGFVCPSCGNSDPDKVAVTRRVCGYLGSPDARPFNEGKQEEVKRRVKHL
jgi:ribonucleoside-triphosphate reductase